MKKYYCYSAQFDKDTEELFKKSEFLGQGNNGVVYKLPHNKVIKIFAEEKVCKDESSILLRAQKSSCFPRVYSVGRLYVVRDMVDGIRLDTYIKKNGLDEEVSSRIVYTIKQFKKLNFTKIDARCKDLFVCKDNKIMMIDPKKNYTKKIDYPRHLMKGLNKLGVLYKFLLQTSYIDRKLAIEWENKFLKYCDKKIVDYKYKG